MSKKNAQVKNQGNPPKGNGKPVVKEIKVKEPKSPIIKVNRNGVAVYKEGMHPRLLRSVREEKV